MLRITDARTGHPVPAAPVRRGLTRVEVHAPAHGTGALRVLLVADVLVRALELDGTPVWTLLTGDHERADLRAAAAALGIRPFEDSGGGAAGLGGAQVLHVAPAGADVPDGVLVEVADVDAPDAVPVEGAGPDPAALRLALLSERRDVPVRLDAAALGEAGDTLGRWRRTVADWARLPSRPVPEALRVRLRAAWEDDLDVPQVLRVLREVEDDPDLPPGARFETYAYADRLLGLELTREIGTHA
ncbi:hypothetical protein OG481_01580 [Streptomyces longwoodensis]|uniref:hypothetical protein n=1 Tax=Streptomyces longwoodensis TaxID=68231 RepID=UPI002DDA9B50|nr:hypothetical protein [Streptomyces longwoodensis]WRY87286.1 hypothetical protein OG481_01580 [Streptomyces longwoodensis]WUC74600.1 hypothetical protein OG416_29260 [Streptomyces longwoodensis]